MGVRSFLLGGHYEEVGPDLGRLHEARHVATGRPALALLPGVHVDWTPEGDWVVSLFYKRDSSSMTLRVDEAPPSADPVELGNLLALMGAAFQRVEGHPRLSGHLASGRAVPRSWHAGLMPAFAGLMSLMLGCGAWMYGAKEPQEPSPSMASGEAVGRNAPLLTDTESHSSLPEVLAYPLPDKPFADQAAAPCKPKRDEIEINGGCWVLLDRRPPCMDVQAEYQGRCYLPVAKRKERPPQSASP